MIPLRPEPFKSPELSLYGPVSKDIAEELKTHFKRLHPDIHQMLSLRYWEFGFAQRGYDFVKSPLLPINQLGRAAATFHHQDRNSAIVVEQYRHEDGWAKNPFPVVGLYRLTADAISQSLGHLSRRPGFELAYSSDVQALKKTGTVPRNDMLLDQTFSQVWAMQNCPNTVPGHDSTMRQNYPRSWEWVSNNTPTFRHGWALSQATWAKPDLAGLSPSFNVVLPKLNRLDLKDHLAPFALSPLDVPKETRKLLNHGLDVFTPSISKAISVFDTLIWDGKTEAIMAVLDHVNSTRPWDAPFESTAKKRLYRYISQDFPESSREHYFDMVERFRIKPPKLLLPPLPRQNPSAHRPFAG